MKRIFFIITMIAAACAMCHAQTKIDQLMDNFSVSGGSADYKSFVVRDPDTHKVQKIMKTLNIDSHVGAASQFIKAFEAERQNASGAETSRDEDIRRITLVFSTPQKYSVYSLKTEDYETSVIVNVVINYDVEGIQKKMNQEKTNK